jgi:hypothetical protein
MSEETIIHLFQLLEMNREQNDGIIQLSSYIIELEHQLNGMMFMNVASWLLVLFLIIKIKWAKRLR